MDWIGKPYHNPLLREKKALPLKDYGAGRGNGFSYEEPDYGMEGENKFGVQRPPISSFAKPSSRGD